MDNDLKALAQKELLRRAAMKELERRKSVAAPQAQPAADPNFGMGAIAPSWEGVKRGLQTVDDGVRGAANGLTFGVADRFAAYMNGQNTEGLIRGESPLDRERRLSEQARERSPVAYTGGEIAGAVAGMGKIASAGGTAARFIPQGLSGTKAMLAKMLAGGADGLVLNEASNLGYGRDFGENSGLAAVAGAGAPVAAQAGGKIIDLGKAALGVGNEPRAKKAILEALMRSGKSADDIAVDMSQAVDDGQGVYTLADALGNSGQRMLAGVARSPGDMRQTIAETLVSRQSGQGDRLTNALVEGFDAPKTADQLTKTLTESRRAAGAANYGAARAAAGAVDTSAAIQAIDEVVAPGMTPMIGAGASDGSVFSTLKKARSFLTDGTTNVSDFNRALLAKQEMDAIIEAGGTTANLLRPARNALDDALSQSSAPYAQARDAYRQGSKAIEAVDTGALAASGRVRSQDSIPQFQSLSAEEQAAFRTGYADPLIARVQSTASGPSTNKARPLISDKTGQEFPAFAAPGKADQLGRRLAREKTMFETANAALGGSKTADNLADAAEIGGFDPSMIMNALSGNWKQAALAGITKAGNAVKGRNSATRDLIAKALLSTGGEGQKRLAQAVQSGKQLTQKQQMLARMILGASLPMLPSN